MDDYGDPVDCDDVEARLDRVCAALGIDRAEIEALPEMVKVVGYDGELIGWWRKRRTWRYPCIMEYRDEDTQADD